MGWRHGRPNRADPKKGGFGDRHERGGMRRKGREGEEKSVGGDKWGGGGGWRDERGLGEGGDEGEGDISFRLWDCPLGYVPGPSPVWLSVILFRVRSLLVQAPPLLFHGGGNCLFQIRTLSAENWRQAYIRPVRSCTLVPGSLSLLRRLT